MAKLKNIKHESFCRAIVENKGHQSLSYKEVYPHVKDNTARVNGSQLLQRENIRQRVYELMEQQKSTRIDTVIDNMGQLTKANKTIVCDKELVSVEDNATRIESNKVLLKLYGVLSDSGGSPTLYAQQNNFNFGTLSEDRLSKIADNLTALNNELLRSKTEFEEPSTL